MLPDLIHSSWFASAGSGVVWLITLALMVSGLIGSAIPALPGHLLILMGAIAHRLLLGREGSGLEWWSFAVLIAIMGISQAIETLSGAAGSKWFGGSKWGAFGAFVGGIVGLFFMPFGLLLGPLIGAIVCEAFFAKQKTKTAAMSGIGSAVGVLAGIGTKVFAAVLMIAYFFADVFWLK